MNQRLHRDPATITHGSAALLHLRDLCSSLTYATLLTDDGFEVTSLGGADIATARMASMASSMQALGDAVTRELRIGAADYIIIASASGYVIQLRVPGQQLVLSALFDADETVGKALSSARLAIAEMAGGLGSAGTAK